jgi:hypothetical protein
MTPRQLSRRGIAINTVRFDFDIAPYLLRLDHLLIVRALVEWCY